MVRLNYRGTTESRRELADEIGVTPTAVAGQVARMGIAKTTARRPWNAEEDQRLRELSATMGLPAVAAEMGRTINSVNVRAKRLGISRRGRDGWFTLREVCHILGQDHHWVQHRIDSGQIPAQRHHGEGESDKPAGRMWHIAAPDLAHFIRTHPEDLEGRNVDLIAIVETLTGLEPTQASAAA